MKFAQFPNNIKTTFANGWTVSVSQRMDSDHLVEAWSWKDTSFGATVDRPSRGPEVMGDREAVRFMNEVADRCHCGQAPGRSDHCDYCGCEEHESTCERIAPEFFDINN